MGTVTKLKFISSDEVEVAQKLHSQGWTVRFIKSADTDAEEPNFCAYITEDNEPSPIFLHCPECFAEVEVWHVEWSALVCPICNEEVDVENWLGPLDDDEDDDKDEDEDEDNKDDEVC